MEGDTLEEPLFQDVVYTVIPGELGDVNIDTIMTALESAGARLVPLREDTQEIKTFEDLTHIISSHIDFPQYTQVLDREIPVVRPGWVLESVKKRKLASTRQYSPDPSQIFREVVIFCADVPDGDAEAICAGVIALGGQYSEKLAKTVTHIVSLSAEHPRLRGKHKVPDSIIVLPHWFHDCFSLGKRISEKPYLLPDPEILRDNKTGIRGASSPDLDGAISATPKELPQSNSAPSPSKNRKNLDAFRSKKLFISDDHKLSEQSFEVLKQLINKGGGTITDNVNDADIYIGHWRQGEDYVRASRANKQVANLSWLYHVIHRNRWTNPRHRLFHYPLPRHGVDGFQNMKISLSNYSGPAREYVENLIQACGATYTKTMKQDNTHLVTAHKNGEKCDAAQEWNIAIVNHLWLEESYAKCQIQAMSNPKYAHFPVRTNLGEVAGQTSLDMKAVEKLYFQAPRSPPKQRVVQKSSPPRKTVPASSAVGRDGFTMAANDDFMMVDQHADFTAPMVEADEMEVDEDPAPRTAQKTRGRPSKSAMATPRVLTSEKENATPASASTCRASKIKARANLYLNADDIALYEKQKKWKGGITHGGVRGSVAEEASPVPQRTSKKRPSDEYDPTALNSDLSDGETQAAPAKQAKKAKHASSAALPPIEHRMMVTGDERWQDNQKKESADRNLLRSMGVFLTQDPKDVTILVAPRILRTRKFVCAMACAPIIVHTSFLDTALNKKQLVEDPSMLKDRESEERMGFTLADSIKRAKENRHKLFRGWTIFIVDNIKGGFDTFKDIVTLNGGTAMLYKGRLGVAVTKRPRGTDDPNAGAECRNQGGDEEVDYVYLVSGKSNRETTLWKSFRENAAKHDLVARIVDPDWLLTAAMSQRITFEEKWELDESKETSQRAG